MSITLYHYTDAASANSISSSKIMYKLTDTIADARWVVVVLLWTWTQIVSRLNKFVTTTDCRLNHLRLQRSWRLALQLHFPNRIFKIAVRMTDEYFCILVGM